MLKEPRAKKIAYEHKRHGDIRYDPYYWLREKENEEVLQYLEEENKYHQEAMGALKKETEELYQQILSVIPKSEERVAIQKGPYYYYYRFEKEKQYPIFARKRAANREELREVEEEILLDENELAEGLAYLNISTIKVDPNHQWLAYLENRDGTDRYRLRIKEIKTGAYLPDEIEDIYFSSSIAWSACSKYIFYITVDEQQRPYQVYRHRLGSNPKEDILLYEEKDSTFSLYLEKSMSEDYIFFISLAKKTSEVRFLKAQEAEADLRVFQTRQRGVLYHLEHFKDHFLILTNEEAVNFKLLSAPVEKPEEQRLLLAGSERRYLIDVFPFQQGILIYGREDALSQVWTLRKGVLEKLTWQEEVYQVSIPRNQSYDTDEILIEYESRLEPKITYSLEFETRELKTIQIDPVFQNYEQEEYVQKRLWVRARDGEQIPLTLTYKKGALDHGPAPLLLYGYGSYGVSINPTFNPYLFPLLDRGIVYVTAHIRGGSECGRSWYEQGKMMQKKNTFTDFIDASQYLIEEGYTTKELLAAQGGSAGGLLIGAVANMAGELYKVLVAEVPFVDVLTTMLDESLPLTASEWDEWGDPREKEAYYYIKSYSPYDHVEAKAYPHMYVTAGLNDPRVPYWEPAKWVAKLREKRTDSNTILLKTHMGAGHFGSSGRLNYLKEVAELYAFLLNKLGLSKNN